MEIDVLLKEAMECAMRLSNSIRDHEQKAREETEDLITIKNQISSLMKLGERRRDAVLRRWKTRIEARVAREQLKGLIKMNPVKRAGINKAITAEKAANQINEKVVSKSFVMDRTALSSGIYFLIKGKSVVYVGQSVNVLARVAQHRNKQFDRVAFVNCHPEELNRIERVFIDVLLPELNKDQTTTNARIRSQSNVVEFG